MYSNLQHTQIVKCQDSVDLCSPSSASTRAERQLSNTSAFTEDSLNRCFSSVIIYVPEYGLTNLCVVVHTTQNVDLMILLKGGFSHRQ